MPNGPSSLTAVDAAAAKARDLLGRLVVEDQGMILAAYRASRGRLEDAVEFLFRHYFPNGWDWAAVRASNVWPLLQSRVRQTVDELQGALTSVAVGEAEAVWLEAAGATARLYGVEPTFTSLGMFPQALSTEWAGATVFDRFFNVTEDLAQGVVSQTRTSILAQETFEEWQARVRGLFGDTTKLYRPKASAYGSVKVWENEAKRLWNLQQELVAEEAGVEPIWWAILDERTSPGCASMHGRRRSEVPEGVDIPKHINCVLPGTLVSGSFVSGLKAWYAGPARELITSRGYRLAVTVNHPVVTDRGILPAYELRKGDAVLSACRSVEAVPCRDDQDAPAMVEQVFETLAAKRDRVFVQAGSLDLDGDGGWLAEGKIEIVGAGRELLLDRPVLQADGAREGRLVFAYVRALLVACFRALMLSYWGVGSSPAGVPSCAALAFHGSAVSLYPPPFQVFGIRLAAEVCAVAAQQAFNGSSCSAGLLAQLKDRLSRVVAGGDCGGIGQRTPAQAACFGVAADWDVSLPEEARHDAERAMLFSRQVQERSAGLIAPDQIIEVREFDYHGHVFDLQSSFGWFAGASILQKNCRCQWVVPDPSLDLGTVRGFEREGRAAADDWAFENFDDATEDGEWDKAWRRHAREAADPEFERKHPREPAGTPEGGQFAGGPEQAREPRGEAGMVIDRKTGQVLSRSETGLSVGEEWQQNVLLDHMAHTDKDVLLVHTHPDTTSFSDADWRHMGWGHIGEMQVVTSDGSVHTLRRDPGDTDWQKRTPRAIREKWNEIENDIFASGRSLSMSIPEIIEEINQRLAKATGIIWTKTDPLHAAARGIIPKREVVDVSSEIATFRRPSNEAYRGWRASAEALPGGFDYGRWVA